MILRGASPSTLESVFYPTWGEDQIPRSNLIFGITQSEFGPSCNHIDGAFPYVGVDLSLSPAAGLILDECHACQDRIRPVSGSGKVRWPHEDRGAGTTVDGSIVWESLFYKRRQRHQLLSHDQIAWFGRGFGLPGNPFLLHERGQQKYTR